MYEAYVRKRGTSEWRVMTWSNSQFRADKQQIENMIFVMQMHFPQNEYKVEKVNGN